MARSGSQRSKRTSPRVRTRRRRNLEKFVPSGDSDFAMVSRWFADYLAVHHEACNVAAADVEELSDLVERFRKALALAVSRSTAARSKTDQKNAARKAAEKKMRAIGAKIRTDPAVEWEHKFALRLVGLSRRKKSCACPQRPPALRFVNNAPGTADVLGAGNGSGMHVLKFYDEQSDRTGAGSGLLSKARPEGATRLELFVGFLPQSVPSAAVPLSPHDYQQQGFGWPLYLRSFSKSPIEVRFPMPDRPMLIVYWARWANEKGEHSAFCKTVVARVEGWSRSAAPLPDASRVTVEHGRQHALPAANAVMVEAQRTQARFLLIGTPLEMSAGEDGHEAAAPDTTIRRTVRGMTEAA